MGTVPAANLPKTESGQQSSDVFSEQDRLPKTTAPQPDDCGVAEYAVGFRQWPRPSATSRCWLEVSCVDPFGHTAEAIPDANANRRTDASGRTVGECDLHDVSMRTPCRLVVIFLVRRKQC